MAENMRIGDAERDEAVSLLRDHHAEGRLSSLEFDDRMTRALEARTQRELTDLFFDLPGHKPGERFMTMPEPGPQPVVAPMPMMQPPGEVSEARATPWYAQWWMMLAAVFLVAALDFSGVIIAFAALWIWVIYPSMERSRVQRELQSPPPPPRPLTYMEREYVMDELRAGRQIQAVKRYRELTGADLRTAKFAVDEWRRQIGR